MIYTLFSIVQDELRCDIKQKAREVDPTQTQLDSFVQVRSPDPHSRTVINLLDSKTRSQATLPSHSDAYPSRLQLMLYRRLFAQALEPPNEDTTFTAFCARIGLNVDEEFSNGFLEEMATLVVQNELSFHFLDAKCLSDMGPPFYDTLANLGLNRQAMVSSSLTVQYRLRDRKISRKRRRSPESDAETPTTPAVEIIGPIKDEALEPGSPEAASTVTVVGASHGSQSTTDTSTASPSGK